MSSTASSTLTLELRPAWPALAGLALWVLCLAAAAADLRFPAGATKLIPPLLILVTGFFLLRGLSGLHPRAPGRALLRSDGEWLLTGQGGSWTAALDPASRALGGVMFLRWRSAQGVHWALVTRSAENRDALRRLRVRLRCAQSC